MKTIQIDQDLYSYLVSKAESPGEPPAQTLRRELHVAPPLVSLDIDDEVYAFLLSKTTTLGEPASTIIRRELGLDGGGPGPGGPTIVTFRIPAGTGASAWNTQEAPVVATVGDTLRVVNDDAVAHGLHTSGVPFPHPASDIAPGASQDFVLQSAFNDQGVTQPLHDHDFGPPAQFWIQVRRP